MSKLKTVLPELKGKCDEMEGRMKRCNVWIFSVPEMLESSSTAAVAELLVEVLKQEKEPLIDCMQ